MSVLSRCRCLAYFPPCFAAERGAHVKFPLRQDADFGRSGIGRYNTCADTAVKMRGLCAQVLATLSWVSAFP